MNNKKGFTLAETLIVIAIIGIIASIAIPTLFGTTSDAELKAAWKKSYSDIVQAGLLVMQENGGSYKYTFGRVDDIGSEDFKNAFMEKMNYIKNCSGTSTMGGSGDGASVEGCWHRANEYSYLKGTLYTTDKDDPGLILNSGTLIRFRYYKPDCSDTANRCAIITVDINGFKKPNIIGKDIFQINVYENSLKPSLESETSVCVEGSTETYNSGWACSAKYLYTE
ncbi:MAG: prepilin-type N-terminal cleavage/methylation domain-containing protein [Candidatus Gastranaerophilales bacterium]|nr:prepilin-type N-terminal cleavage/methylation domain-containing protein [Candidatus Gastranaerophilales bacterium]